MDTIKDLKARLATLDRKQHPALWSLLASEAIRRMYEWAKDDLWNRYRTLGNPSVEDSALRLELQVTERAIDISWNDVIQGKASIEETRSLIIGWYRLHRRFLRNIREL